MSETAAAMETEPLLITAQDVAKLLNVSSRSIWRMRSAGELPAPLRVGSSIRWRRAEIEIWIASGCPIPTSARK